MIAKLEFLFRESCSFGPAWTDDYDDRAATTAAIHALSARSFDISQNLAGRPPLFDVDGVSYVSDDGQFV